MCDRVYKQVYSPIRKSISAIRNFKLSYVVEQYTKDKQLRCKSRIRTQTYTSLDFKSYINPRQRKSIARRNNQIRKSRAIEPQTRKTTIREGQVIMPLQRISTDPRKQSHHAAARKTTTAKVRSSCEKKGLNGYSSH
jgi:hypothetical protein